jgi:hypothetical protein
LPKHVGSPLGFFIHHHEVDSANLHDDQGKAFNSLLHGNYNLNDMEHLDNKEWLDVNDIDLQVLACERKFLSEFPLIMLRVKPDMVPAMETWVNLV